MDKVREYKAIIVDDEEGCIINLKEHLVRLCPKIKVLASSSDLTDAINKTNHQGIDVAFLDISLSGETIFGALANMDLTMFKIIFVTAYSQYAIKAIKNDAFDYLL